jgi:predicted transcriptional regulator
MEQSNNQQNLNLLNEQNYLVTQAVSTSSLPQTKVLSDLEEINKAEKKISYRADISKGKRDPQISRAMSALRLANPFKGY